MSNNIHADQIYIDGLSSNNSEIINQIYKKYVPKVIHYIKSNSGDNDRAQDIVQEILIVLFNQAKANKLQLTCPFDAYFFLLCKRRWLNELKNKTNNTVTITDNFISTNESEQQMIEQTELYNDKQQLFDEMFSKIGNKCQELLTMTYTIKSLEEIAVKLNVTYGYVRKKKSNCMGQLTAMVQESSRYNNLKN